MLRALAFLIIGLVFGAGIGFVLASAQPEQAVAADNSAMTAMDHAAMGHAVMAPVEIADGPQAPTVALAVFPDSDTGWNLHIQTTGFTFAGANAGAAHVLGEGHAHIYANGKKLARAYGPWVHIESLPAGVVDLKVSLNTNDHRAILVGGEALEARLRMDTAN